MTYRSPPPLATWLLKHFGKGYHSESLAGDLYEEYQHNGTAAWYWRQVMLAIVFAQLHNMRRFPLHGTRPRRRQLFVWLALVVGADAIAGQCRHDCAPLAELAGNFAAVLAIAAALWIMTLLLRSLRTRRLLACLALIALGGGALAWASVAPGVPSDCTFVDQGGGTDGH